MRFIDPFDSRQTVGTVPPSTMYSLPVMEAARGEARNAMRCSPKWKRMAILLEPDRAGSLSEMASTPSSLSSALLPARMACSRAARVSFATLGDGVNLPAHIDPLA